MNGSPWTQEEDNILRENFRKVTKTELAELLPGRTYQACSRRFYTKDAHKKTGGYQKWTEKEIKVLKENYPKMQLKDLYKLFPNRDSQSIVNKAHRLGLKRDSFYFISQRSTKYSKNHKFFSKPNYLNSYWAGFIAADGNVVAKTNRIRIGLARIDRAHLENFKRDTDYTGPVVDHDMKSGFNSTNGFSKIIINGVPEWLYYLEKFYNVTPNKTYSITFPRQLPEELHLPYAIGYIDGDGCITNTSAGTPCVSMRGNYYMLDRIKEIFDEMFPSPFPSQSPPAKVAYCSGLYRYAIAGRRAQSLIDYVNQLDLPILDRKWKKFYNESK